MYTLYVKEKFNAAHRLLDYDGKCNNLHGHTWLVEVSLQGDKLDDQMMVVDFGLVKSIIREFDHRVILNKNDPLVEFCEDLGLGVITLAGNPTAEILAQDLYLGLSEKLLDMTIKSVKVWESENAWAEYTYC